MNQLIFFLKNNLFILFQYPNITMHTVNSRRQHSTNSAGLRQSTAPYARPESSNADQANSNHAGSFPLRATRFPNGTPLIA